MVEYINFNAFFCLTNIYFDIFGDYNIAISDSKRIYQFRPAKVRES